MNSVPSAAALRSIEALCEEGSLSAAARRLGVSHTAISHHVRAFEERHGFRLFERAHGRYVATPVCTALVELSQRHQEIDAEIARLVARKNPEGQMQLRVGLGNTMPGLDIIRELVEHHPNVSVTIESGSHQAVMRAMLRREVDVALLPDIPPDPRFRLTPVVEQEVVALLSCDHPMAGKSSLSLEDLHELPLIFRSRGSSTQRALDRAFARAGFTPHPRLTADTREAVFEAVILGLGIGFMWRHGTHRASEVSRVPVDLPGLRSQEVIFALASERNPLVDMMFLAARRWQTNLAGQSGMR